MNIFNIITKSIHRRKAKYLFLLTIIVLGVTITTGLTEFSSTMNLEITKKMEKYGANIVILPGMESLPLTYGGISLGSLSYDMKSLKQKDLLKLKTIKNSGNIAASGSFLLGVVEIKKRKVLICGIEMKTIPYLRPWWEIKNEFPRKNEILAGKEAARLLGLKKNDSVSINNKKLSIKTILKHTGSQDDNIIFVELATAQRILNKKGIISFTEVAAYCSGCPIDDMVNQISSVLPKARVSGIKQVIGARMQSISMIRTFTSGTSIVVILLSILMISAVMMGNVRDRTSELGLYRAIGFKKNHIKTLVLGEVFTVSFIAGIIGYLLGVILANGILRIMGEPSVLIVLPNILHGLLAIITTIIVTLIAGSFPARTAARMDPVSALRHL
jgi:putative ABC transport system permease protein